MDWRWGGWTCRSLPGASLGGPATRRHRPRLHVLEQSESSCVELQPSDSSTCSEGLDRAVLGCIACLSRRTLFGTAAALLLIPLGFAVALSGLWVSTYVAHWIVDGLGHNHPAVLLVGVAALWPALLAAKLLPGLRARPWDLFARRAWVVYVLASAFLIDFAIPLPALGAQTIWWPLHYVVIAWVAAWPLRRQGRSLGPERVESGAAETSVYALVGLIAITVSGDTKEDALRSVRLNFGMTSAEVIEALDDQVLMVTYAGDPPHTKFAFAGAEPEAGGVVLMVRDFHTPMEVHFEADRGVRIDYNFHGFRED